MNYIFYIVIVLVFGLTFISFLRRKKSAKFLSDFSFDKIPLEGYRIPVLATFRGFNNIPLVAIAHNNAFPRLIIYRDHVKFLVVFPFIRKYEDILKVGIFRTIGTENICITFKDSNLNFSANLFDRKALKNLIIFFKNKGIKIDLEADDFIKLDS